MDPPPPPHQLHSGSGIRNYLPCSAFAKRPYRHEPLQLGHQFSSIAVKFSRRLECRWRLLLRRHDIDLSVFDFELMSFQGQKDVGARRHDTDLKLANNMECKCVSVARERYKKIYFCFRRKFHNILFHSRLGIIVTKPICRTRGWWECGGGGGEVYKFGLWLVRFCVDIYRFLLLFLLLFLFLCFWFFFFSCSFFFCYFWYFYQEFTLMFSSSRAPEHPLKIKESRRTTMR